LRHLIKEAVRYRLVSDVPLGAFLSGGVDSSTVVAIMTQLLDRPVKTFSVGFPEADFNEATYAREVSKIFGTEHYELEVTPSAVEIIDDLIWCLDEPMGDSSAIPTYLVSKLARQHVTVALSGDGGDEMFAGYDHYLRFQSDAIVDKVPLRLRKQVFAYADRLMPAGMRGRNLLRHYSLPPADRMIESGTFFNETRKYQALTTVAYQQILTETRAPLYPPEYRRLLEQGSLVNVLYVDLKRYLPLDILTKVDRMSMAHSLEARVPLLDHELASFIATIPPELKLRGKTTKYILKQAMRGILPDSILDRKKQGFALPLKHWFRNQWKPFLLDHLLDDTTRSRGIINHKYVQQLYAEHCAGKDNNLLLWMLLVFELWCRRFIDSRTLAKDINYPPVSESQLQKVRHAKAG
jgi:asparagine synthase (glutamine-hydrolysing)